VIEKAKRNGSLAERYAVSEVLKESFSDELAGAVFAINDERSAYADIW